MLTSTGRVTTGRPNKMVDDEGRFACRTRIAWLLRTSRLYGHDPDLAVARHCVTALSTHLGPVTPSRISRWENGVQPVPYPVIRSYEEVLGLPAGRLSAAVDTVHQVRSVRPGAPRLDRRFVPDARLASELDDLLDRCLGDAPVRGADWDAMSARVLALPHVYLPRATWGLLTTRLLAEMSVSRWYAYLPRWEALRRLQGHPVARGAIAAAVAEMVADPAGQVVVDPLMLLVHDRHSTRLLVGEVAAPTSERTLHAALAVCELAAEAGRFGGDDAAALDVLVRAHLADRGLPAHVRPAAVDLAARLAPPGTRPAAGAGRGDQDVAAGRAAVVASLTTAAEAALDVTARGTSASENRMLSRLVDELLFSGKVDVRLGAAAVLAASPFGGPLGDALADDLAAAAANGGRSPLLGERVFALGALGGAGHRRALEALLGGRVPSAVAAQAAVGLGNLPGRTGPAVFAQAVRRHGGAWRRSGRDDAEEVLRAVVYAAGMQGATSVLADVRSRPDLPAGVRAAAGWWLARPGAAPEE
ncbi:helix-turn-helix transcriptional regulator [Saccharothrix longispora]|uniref:helix-turn-helix transcriptional regulator n=1 Tax=Saccharothrix longispora TaxID=33920 RepID=UPI0028FD9831|nr:helix-turn-helix transcriptional regulator [Saccharothrix longispora]MDU0292685.1 helix-turn-helix transcriptional regulator [Saccharothrix longispora]